MELEIESEEPISVNRHSPLMPQELDHLFLYHKYNKAVPFRPKGGEVYVFRPESVSEIKDWVADGHNFSCEGSRKMRGRSGPICKKYHYLLLKTEKKKRITDKRFKKEVYTSENFPNTVILHYIGDETLSVPRAHGNSLRQTRISIRTKPSVTEKITEKIRDNTDKPAHKLYKEVVSEGTTLTEKPKNNRQVHYLREKVKTENRPTKDALINLQALAYEEDFIHYIATYPDISPISGAVKIYDSGNAFRVSSSIEKSIANMLKTPEQSITCRLMNNDMQPNPNDCGVYAIAFAVSLAYKNDPVNLCYDNSRMRGHLMSCINNGYMTEFPHSRVTRTAAYTQVHNLEIHCTCRMPDYGYMFQCTRCQLWFHPECQEIKLSKRQILKSKTIKCLECRS